MKPLTHLAAFLCLALPARADTTGVPPRPPALAELIERSRYILVLEVHKIEGGEIFFKKDAVLKGEAPGGGGIIFHNLAADGSGTFPDAVLRWAKPGRLALVFMDADSADERLLCFGNTWCVARTNQGGRWRFWQEPPEYLRTYVGRADRLRDHVKAILAGKDVVVTAQAAGGAPEAYGPSPMPRDWVRGRKGRVWRIKAGPARTLPLWERSRQFVGWGVGDKEVVPALVKALGERDPHVRAEAAEDLGRLGSVAKPALAALQRALADEDGHVRVFAAEAILRIDPDDRRAAPVLAAALRSLQIAERRAAVSSLAALGARAAPLAPDLLAVFQKNDDLTQAGAGFALKEILRETDGPPDLARLVMPALAESIRPVVSGEVRYQAVRALLKCGPEAKTVRPALVRALRDDRPSYLLAADLLVRLGPASATALGAGITDTYSPSSRLAALDALGKLGPDGRPALIPLLGVLKEDDSSLRLAAALATYRVEPARADRMAAPVLRGLLDDPNTKRDRYAKLLSLSEVGPAARGLVPILAEDLWDPNPGVSSRAAQILGWIGAPARDALPTLEVRARKETSTIREEAALALWLIDRRVEPPLLRSVSSTAPLPSGKTLEEELAEHPPRDATAIREALKDPRPGMREGAARAARCLADARPMLPALRELLNDNSLAVSVQAGLTILTMEPRDADARAAVRTALRKNPTWINRLAGGLDRADPQWLLPTLRELHLVEQPEAVDFAVLRALARLGAPARPFLQELARSENPRTAARAAVCLFLFAAERETLLALVAEHPETILALPDDVTLDDAGRQALAARSSAWLLRATRDENSTTSRAAQRCLRSLDPGLAARAWDTGEPKEKALPWENLDAARLERLWKDLAESEPEAYRALWTLALAGKPAAELLRSRVPAVPVEIPPEVSRMVAELDDDQFTVRERATVELAKRGEVAERALKRALAAEPPLEVRNRGERILRQLAVEKRPGLARTLRAIEALTYNEAAEARAVLEAVAKGAPESPVTQAARRALAPAPAQPARTTPPAQGRAPQARER